VTSELMRLLAPPDSRADDGAMAGAGGRAEVLPEADLTPLFAAAVEQSGDPVVRLMVLLPADERVAREAASRLRFPNATRDRLAFATRAVPAARLTTNDLEARPALHPHGVAA